MKRWQGQLFPLFILLLLAALTFWLQCAIELPETRKDGKTRHDPDAFVENFVVRRFNVDGLVQYRLVAPFMQHFPDDDSSLFREPALTYYRPGAPDMTLVAQQGYASSKGESVYFWDQVVATRAASPERPEAIIRTPDLTVQPDTGFAFTNSPVEVTQGSSWTRGIGMTLDNNASTMVLKSRVAGYHPPSTKPRP